MGLVKCQLQFMQTYLFSSKMSCQELVGWLPFPSFCKTTNIKILHACFIYVCKCYLHIGDLCHAWIHLHMVLPSHLQSCKTKQFEEVGNFGNRYYQNCSTLLQKRKLKIRVNNTKLSLATQPMNLNIILDISLESVKVKLEGSNYYI